MTRKSLAPKRVLICRLSAIGDCVHTIPLAVKVKQLWPDCKLTWVVDCPAAQLLQPHTAIDEVIKIERHWVKNSKLWKSLRRELQARKFCLALDPQGLIKSSMLAWLSGAKTRVGFDLLARSRTGADVSQSTHQSHCAAHGRYLSRTAQSLAIDRARSR